MYSPIGDVYTVKGPPLFYAHQCRALVKGAGLYTVTSAILIFFYPPKRLCPYLC